MAENLFIKNLQLPGDDFFFAGNSTGILLIHGFTATTAEVRPLAEILHAEGYTVAGPLLPGHGTHPDDMNRATWAMWVEKTKQVYEKLLGQCQQVFVGGESMGALLALELALQHPETRGLILFAPAIKVPGLWRSRLVYPFIKYLKKPDTDDGLAWKGYNVTPIKASAELHKLQKQVQQRLPSINQPALIFTGEYDKTIAPESGQIIMDGISSTQKQLIHMMHSSHCIILDRELNQVANLVKVFIEENC